MSCEINIFRIEYNVKQRLCCTSTLCDIQRFSAFRQLSILDLLNREYIGNHKYIVQEYRIKKSDFFNDRDIFILYILERFEYQLFAIHQNYIIIFVFHTT